MPTYTAAALQTLVLDRLDKHTPDGSPLTVPASLLSAEIEQAADDVVLMAPRSLLFEVAQDYGAAIEGYGVTFGAVPEGETLPRYCRVLLPENFLRLVSFSLTSFDAPISEDRLMTDESEHYAALRSGRSTVTAGYQRSGLPALVLVPATNPTGGAQLPGRFALEVFPITEDEYDVDIPGKAATFAIECRAVCRVAGHNLPGALRDACAWRAAQRVATSYLQDTALADRCGARLADTLEARTAFAARLATAPTPTRTFTRTERPLG